MSDPLCDCGPIALAGGHSPACPLRPCPARLPLGDDPGTVLRCDLPAAHLSLEHYDRATGTVWLPDGAAPPVHDPMPYDGPSS